MILSYFNKNEEARFPIIYPLLPARLRENDGIKTILFK